MTHKFKEFRFDSFGEHNGLRCAVQTWKCTECGTTTDLPMGMNPSDYHNGYCQPPKKEKEAKKKWKHPIKDRFV